AGELLGDEVADPRVAAGDQDVLAVGRRGSVDVPVGHDRSKVVVTPIMYRVRTRSHTDPVGRVPACRTRRGAASARRWPPATPSPPRPGDCSWSAGSPMSPSPRSPMP